MTELDRKRILCQRIAEWLYVLYQPINAQTQINAVHKSARCLSWTDAECDAYLGQHSENQ